MSLPYPPDVLAVLKRGDEAKALLESETFTDIVNDLTQLYVGQFFAAKPGEAHKDAREYAHLMQYALTELVAQIQGYVKTAERMREAQEYSDPEDLESLNPDPDKEP